MQDTPPDGPDPIDGLETRPFRRDLALARLGLGIGARFTGHLLMNTLRNPRQRAAADRSFYRDQAMALAEELGRLKGGAMKAGQLLGLFGQQVLPAEAVTVLAGLHDLAQPVAWDRLAPALERYLGRRRMAELEIDPVPVGAASLGQVHRATRKADGAALCLKILYPGVEEAIDSDVQSVARLLAFSRLAPRDLDLTPTFAELKRVLRMEADYVRERRFTEEYGRRLAADPRFVVPRIFPDYCGPHVLAMSYEEGLSVLDPAVQRLAPERRNRLARTLIDLFLEEFFEWGTVQTDPNFGNFRFRLDDAGNDRIVLLDFGATRRFSDAFVAGYREVVRGALLRDRDRIVRGAADIGILKLDFPESVHEGFARMCEVIVEPFNDHDKDGTPRRLLNARGEYRWAGSDMLGRAAVAAARSSFTRFYRLPPPELVSVHRRLMGVFVMLGALGAEFNARKQLIAALDAVRPEDGGHGPPYDGT